MSLLAGMALSAGGVMPYSAPYEVAFSPDGKTVAFTWMDAIYIGTPLIEDIAAGVMPESYYGQWSSARTTAFPSGVRVDGGVATAGERDHDLQGRTYAPRFSPDSRYVAFASESRIAVVQPGDSRLMLRIEPDKGGRIVGLTWSAGGEFLYATSLPNGDWTFCRRDVSAGNASPRQVRRVALSPQPSRTEMAAGSIYWSPSGRWAVVNVQDPPKTTSAPKGGDIAHHAILLDLETGRDKELTAEVIECEAWKNDAEATCTRWGAPKPGDPNTQCVLHVPSGELTPLPAKPEQDYHKLSGAMGLSWYTRWSPLPSRPGWLIAFDPDANDVYAVNPCTKTKVKLNDVGTMAYAVSADGRKLAHVNAFKKLTVLDIVLPANK